MKTIWKILLAVVVIILLISLVRGGNNSPADPKRGTGAVPVQDSLPKAVEEKRQAIAQAAKERDYEKLAALASTESFNYSFGGPYEGGFVEYLKKQEERDIDVFDRITKILAMPYYQQENVYAWPQVFGVTPIDWTKENLAQMKEIGYSDEAIESFRKYGSYTGHRIGIREDGQWLFFVAGD